MGVQLLLLLLPCFPESVKKMRGEAWLWQGVWPALEPHLGGVVRRGGHHPCQAGESPCCGWCRLRKGRGEGTSDKWLSYKGKFQLPSRQRGSGRRSSFPEASPPLPKEVPPRLIRTAPRRAADT